MSDGMTDESRRDRQAAKRDPVGPTMASTVFGGLRVDPAQRRMARLEKLLEDITVSISRLDTRTAMLEAKTHPSEIRKVAHS